MQGMIHDMVQWVIAWAHTPYGPMALALLAFAESSFFPIPPDVLLIALCLLDPSDSFYYAAVCTAASVAGGAFGYGLGRYGGRPLLRRFVSEEKITAVERYYQRYDVWAVGIAGFTPIPYKVFTISAGTFLLNFKRFLAASAAGRGGRFFMVGTLFYFFGEPIGGFIQRYLNLLSVAFVVLLAGGFLLVHQWGRRRRASTSMMILAVILGLAGPVRADTGKPVDGDWLIVHLPAEPSTLNPITATDAYASQINDYIYESLLRRDPKTMELVPVLADSWEVSEDRLTYTFHLKKDIFWEDGKPFSAKDVVFSYERIQDPGVDAAHLRNYYRDIEKVEALDDHTVRYTYRMPYFRALEFCGGIPIVPAHRFSPEDDFNRHPIMRHPVGTGPYRLLHWDTGKEIVLVRNEGYWGEKPHLQRIVFKIITDNTVALQVLKKGGLDLMGLRPIQWVKQTGSRKFNQRFKKLKYYQPSYSYIGWNLRKELFSDRRVRRAMTQLLDRETILDRLLFGLGTVVTGTFYVKSPEYNHDIQPYPYDPQEAIALLEAAGWKDRDGDGILDRNGVPFEFEFLVSAGSKFGEQLATILQQNLKEVGIRMGIRKLEWAVFIQKIQSHEFDACTLAWSLSWESDPYQLWHSSQADRGSNFVGFRHEEADRIIEAARTEFDPEKRRRLYHRFHEILHEEQPYTFLFTTEALVAVDGRFQNVKVYPMGLEPREWWVPEKLQRYRNP